MGKFDGQIGNRDGLGEIDRAPTRPARTKILYDVLVLPKSQLVLHLSARSSHIGPVILNTKRRVLERTLRLSTCSDLVDWVLDLGLKDISDELVDHSDLVLDLRP